jgi:hypothetical protein
VRKRGTRVHVRFSRAGARELRPWAARS